MSWQEQPGLWLLGSLVANVVASNLAGVASWYLQTSRPGLISERRQSAALWVLRFARWAYMIAPPYALLLMGILSPRSLGLAEIDWVQDLGIGGGLTAAALALLCLGWWSYRRSLPSVRDRPGAAVPWPVMLAWLTAAAEALALQAHWGFYRTVVGGAGGWFDYHWGVWAGMGFVALEWLLNPLLRSALRRPPDSDPVVRRAVLAVVTTALFIITGNFWVCWTLHALFEAVARSGERPAARD